MKIAYNKKLKIWYFFHFLHHISPFIYLFLVVCPFLEILVQDLHPQVRNGTTSFPKIKNSVSDLKTDAQVTV